MFGKNKPEVSQQMPAPVEVEEAPKQVKKPQKEEKQEEPAEESEYTEEQQWLINHENRLQALEATLYRIKGSI